MKDPVNKWIKVALFNFLLAGLIGGTLRFAFVKEIEWLSYKTFQEAHEHLALLGWSYQALFSLLLAAFIPSDKMIQKKYTILFWCNQILVILITLNFIIAGLNITANILRTLFSFAVFYFIYSFIKDIPRNEKKYLSYSFVKIALLFLGISYLAIYSITPIMMISGTKKLLLYYLAEQFFLHFQYNGWFVFAVLSLVFKLGERMNIEVGPRINLFKNLLVISTFFSFFLSIYWGYQNNRWLLWIASAAGILQILAVIFSWNNLKNLFSALWPNLNKIFRIFLAISILCFLLKLLMQVIVIVPFIASLAFTIRNYVIAYLHLVFIGFLSFFLFGWALHHRFIAEGRMVYAGAYAFMVGFIVMELILFLQGTFLWMGKGFLSFYYPLLFSVTALLPLGLLLMLLNKPRKKYIYREAA